MNRTLPLFGALTLVSGTVLGQRGGDDGGRLFIAKGYAWWYGYAEALGELATIRDDAERLRSESATRKRTLFMIFTGPLMVLAVVGVLWALRRRWERRAARQ